jgi:hypothetical protein
MRRRLCRTTGVLPISCRDVARNRRRRLRAEGGSKPPHESNGNPSRCDDTGRGDLASNQKHPLTGRSLLKTRQIKSPGHRKFCLLQRVCLGNMRSPLVAHTLTIVLVCRAGNHGAAAMSAGVAIRSDGRSGLKPRGTCLEAPLSPWGSPRGKSGLPSRPALAHSQPTSARFPTRRRPFRRTYRVALR